MPNDAGKAEGQLEVGGRPVSWMRDGALEGRPLVLLAHGAGAPRTHPFLQATADGLVARGACVVRFNFPYMERNVREGRRRGPDRPAVLLETVQALVDRVVSWASPARLVLAGKSMGGRMMSMWLAQETRPQVSAAVYLGYPLSPAGNPAKLRGDHLPRVTVPQLFVQGSRDPMCDLDKLRPILDPLPRARLHVVEGGDHSLATSRKQPLAGIDAWLDVVADFLRRAGQPLTPGS